MPSKEINKVNPDENFKTELDRSWNGVALPKVTEIKNLGKEIVESRVPSQILAKLEKADQTSEELSTFFLESLQTLVAGNDQAIANVEKEVNPKLNALNSQRQAAVATIRAGVTTRMTGGAIAGLGGFLVVATGGLALPLVVAAAGAVPVGQKVAQQGVRKRLTLDEEIATLNALVETAKKTKITMLEKHEDAKLIAMFIPTVVRYSYEHAQLIHEEVTKYATEHGTTVDAIAKFIDNDDAKAGKAFLQLLKTEYKLSDLQELTRYSQEAKLDHKPEKQAILQFINHALIPHQDFFEIWASKSQDLEDSIGKVLETFVKGTPKERPKLELFKEKPITLSGRREVSEPSTELDIITPESQAARAIDKANQERSDAEDRVKALMHTLRDPFAGTLKERHTAVKEDALEHVEEFNSLFSGIDRILHNVDIELARLNPRRDRLEDSWDRAAAIESQLELMEARDPATLHAHNSKWAWISEGGKIAVDAALMMTGNAPMMHLATPKSSFDLYKTLGGQIANMVGMGTAHEINNYSRRLRHDIEHAITKKSLEARRRISPEVLKAQLDELDTEITKLTQNREFTEFLTKNGALEEAQAIYTLLPRLIAGENNIDALERRTKKAGYEEIDDFIDELKRQNLRLGEAVENFVIGLANSNDLSVIMAEANNIKEPKENKEKVLVGFVENAVKGHYRDHARQASIVDVLEMRNVISTGSSLQSFGEIVKKETDSSLQALLSGQGNFSLIGSNDIHQIFGFYQDRHGQERFVDLYDKQRFVPKRVNLVLPDELKQRREEVGYARNATTMIPRVSSVFTEICAHEYFLAQGINTVKDGSLAANPQALGAFEMVNMVTHDFIEKLALTHGRMHRERTVGQQIDPVTGQPKKDGLGHQVECLIAESFVDFFSELGARHASDQSVTDRVKKVKNAYSGENYSLATSSYTEVITEDAQEALDLFLKVYQYNLEKHLESATRDNRKALLDQLAEVKEIVKQLQPNEDTLMPDTERARLKAHYRNHSLENVGVNPETWVKRAEAIHKGGKGLNK